MASGPNLGLSLAVSAPFLILFAWYPRFSDRAFARTVPLIALAAAMGSAFTLAGYFRGPSAIAWLDRSNSLFNTAPILVLAFLRPAKPASPGPDPVRWLWTLALAFTVLYALAAPELTSRGLHWGNRYLLVLYPLLALLAGGNLVAWWRAPARKNAAQRGAVLLAIAVSIAAQLYSVDLLHRKQTFTRRLNDEVRARPEQVVVTDVPWAAQEMYSVFYEKPVFFVRSPEHLRQLMEKLATTRYTSLAFVTQGSTDLPASAETVVDDPGLGYFALRIFGLEQNAAP